MVDAQKEVFSMAWFPRFPLYFFTSHIVLHSLFTILLLISQQQVKH
jgi:hypothetical protein